MSRTRRSALNFAVSTLGSVLGVAVGFVATPFLLEGLGAERVGLFRLATDWSGYLSVLEVGVSGALAPLIVQAAATGDRSRVNATLAAGVRTYAWVAVWTLVGGVGLLFALPHLTNVPPGLEGELRFGYALSLLVTLAMPLWVYKPLADAQQKSYLISLLLAVQGVCTAVGCVAAAHAGWGLVGQFAVTAGCILILPVGLMLAYWRTAPPFEWLRPAGDMVETRRRLRGLNRATVLSSLLGRICLLTDTILIGLFVGPAAVAAFFFTTRLAQTAGAQVQAVGGATWAGLAELYQSGKADLFRQRLRDLTKLTATLAGAVVVPLAALAGPFVGLWLPGQPVYAGDAVAALCVLNAVFLAVFSLWGWVFSGTGRLPRLMPYLIGQAALNLGVSVLATWLVGVPGPLIGTAVVNLAYNPWRLTVLLRDEFGLKPRDLFVALLVPLAPALLVLAGLFAVRTAWPDYSWPRLAAEFAAAAGSYLVVAWFVVLSDAERAVFRRLTPLRRGGAARDPDPSNRLASEWERAARD